MRSLNFAQVPRRGYGLHFLAYHRPTDQWLWLHVVTKLSFGPYYMLQTGAEEGCLARRHADGAMRVLAPDDAFWSLLLHCLLDKGAIAPRHRTRLGELGGAARVDGPLARVVEASGPSEWTPLRLIECVRRAEWVALEESAPTLLAAWKRRRAIGARRMLAHHGVQTLDALLNLWRRRGVSVALLGPDGAGKSTVAWGIPGTFIFPVRLVYMGLTGGYLPYVARLRIPGVVLLGHL